MNPTTNIDETMMAREASEAPGRVAQLLAGNAASCEAIAARLNKRRPRLIVTCARGSSDHAATYTQYLSHVHLGIPAMSLPPSIASVYGSSVDFDDVLFLLISQSGQSPDLVAAGAWAAEHGAHVVALVNTVDSPVAEVAHDVLPLHAGPEISVAATKTFLASMAAGAQLISALAEDASLADAVAAIPEVLAAALDHDWSMAVEPLASSHNVFVVGRGVGIAASAEMALKLKETSAIHAESVSSAEILHGPLGLLTAGMPVFVIGQSDAALPSIIAIAEMLHDKGARVFAAFDGPRVGTTLPIAANLHPVVAPLAMVQSFYLMANALSLSRGMDPDRPAHLHKITETQ